MPLLEARTPTCLKQLKKGGGEGRKGGGLWQRRRRGPASGGFGGAKVAEPPGFTLSVCYVTGMGFLTVLGVMDICFLMGVDGGGDNIDIKKQSISFTPNSIPQGLKFLGQLSRSLEALRYGDMGSGSSSATANM